MSSSGRYSKNNSKPSLQTTKKILNQTPLPMCNGVSLFLSSKVVIIISGKFFKILKTWFVSFLAKASKIR
jgi:hypothetical protein